MPYEFHNLEESLKTFLAEVQADAYNREKNFYYKYNNLRIFMDEKKNKTPHFTVRVGISEATFKLDNCEKILGGLGSDDKYIYRWYEKTFINQELKEAWQKTVKFEQVVMKKVEDLPGK